jgi:hypothetical protein
MTEAKSSIAFRAPDRFRSAFVEVIDFNIVVRFYESETMPSQI